MLARVLPLACALLLLVPTIPEAETTEDGVPLVSNPGTPRDGESIASATELWRWGGDEENDPLLARVADAIVAEDGNTYVLDANSSLIHVVDADGALVRSFGGEGQGPGEFQNSVDFAFMPNGDIGIMEMMPGRIVVLDRDGQAQSSFKIGGDGALMSLPQRMAVDDDGLVIGHMSATLADNKMATVNSLSRFTPDGTATSNYLEDRVEQSGGGGSISLNSDDSSFLRRWVLTGDGRVVVFQNAYAYELVTLGPDGTPERVVRREYESRRLTEAELEVARERAAEMKKTTPQADLAINETEPDIREVHPRPNGDLWVATSHGDFACPEGSLGVFDVIDNTGVYTHTLRIDGVDYDPDRDDYVLEDDRLFVFKEAKMAAPKVRTSGGGGMSMMMVTSGGGTEDDDEEMDDPRPIEVISYRVAG